MSGQSKKLKLELPLRDPLCLLRDKASSVWCITTHGLTRYVPSQKVGPLDSLISEVTCMQINNTDSN